MTAFALVNMYRIRKQLMVSSEPQAPTPLEQDTSSAYCHSCQSNVSRIKLLPSTIPELYVLHSCAYHHAGPLFNSEGVLLHVGATIIWSDGRRANFQCAFDQALTQYLEVSLLHPSLLLRVAA